MRNLFRNMPLVMGCIFLILSSAACVIPITIPPLPTPFNVYVTTTGNDHNDCRSQANACLTLRGAIGKAVTGSHIFVGPGTFAAANEVYVNKFVTISGAGVSQTTLTTTNPSSPVLGISGYLVATVSDLTISGGQTGVDLADSSADFVGKNLTISNATVGVRNHVSSGRVGLTDVSILNNSNVGISNAGVLSANVLVVQASGNRGIENSGTMTLDTVTVQQNGHDIPPGVINTAGVQNYPSGNLTITGGQIVNNNGNGIGSGGTLNITNSSVGNNQAIGLTLDGTATVENVVINGNVLEGIGFGYESGDTLLLSKSAVINSSGTPGHGGDGMEIAGGSATIVNATISGNHRAGIDMSGGNVTISYSTIASNGLFGLAGTGAVSVQDSIIELNSTTPGNNCANPSITLSEANLACSDTATAASLHLGPLGASAGTLVVPLLAGSPAIDAATGSCPADDQRGYARPYNLRCDIGAFEFGAGLHSEAASPEAVTSTLGVLQILPTSTPTSTAPVPTPTPSPSPAGLAFTQPTLATDHFYSGGAGCGPLDDKLQVSVSDPSQVSSVVLFFRLTDKAGSGSTPWNNGVAMQSLGQGAYSYDLVSNTIPSFNSYSEAWLAYQFVATGPDGKILLRSQAFTDITLSMCGKK